MTDLLSMPWEELVDAVDVAAARDGRGAGRTLRLLLEHEAAGGDPGDVILRLSCRPHVACSTTPKNRDPGGRNGQ